MVYISFVIFRVERERTVDMGRRTRSSVVFSRESIRVLIANLTASVVCLFRVFKCHARKERDAGGGGFVCALWLHLP